MEAMIQFHSVSKSFGANKVLNQLSLQIPSGAITFLIGKSGEGKSVTIKHMLGLMAPDSGDIVVEGATITKFDSEQLLMHRRNFGMLFQHAALFDSMSVFENIEFPMKEYTPMTPASRKKEVSRLLERVGLPNFDDKFPSELSTGEKKRVGLARALSSKPKILLYDEPTTGMDPLVSEMIDKLIVDINREEKVTSVVISHDLKAAIQTGHQLVFLYKGQNALTGTPKEFQQSDNPVVRQFFSGKTEGPIEFL